MLPLKWSRPLRAAGACAGFRLGWFGTVGPEGARRSASCDSQRRIERLIDLPVVLEAPPTPRKGSPPGLDATKPAPTLLSRFEGTVFCFELPDTRFKCLDGAAELIGRKISLCPSRHTKTQSNRQTRQQRDRISHGAPPAHIACKAQQNLFEDVYGAIVPRSLSGFGGARAACLADTKLADKARHSRLAAFPSNK